VRERLASHAGVLLLWVREESPLTAEERSELQHTLEGSCSPCAVLDVSDWANWR
jgi:hypothetical protein